MEDDAQTLHREWRAIVLSKLTSLEIGLETLKNEVVNVKLHTVSIEEHELLKARVQELENLRNKALAIWAVIQVITVGLGWLLNYLK